MDKYVELEKILRKLAGWIKAEGRKVIKEGNYNITPAQFDVLQWINWSNSTMTELSMKLGVAKSTVTGLVNKLKEEGYVEYSVSDEDRRVRDLKITESGKIIIERVISRRTEFVEQLFSTIDPFLVDEFRKVLRIIANTLEIQSRSDHKTE